MKIIGHYTCSQEGSILEIEKDGPFLSEHTEKDFEKHKFLGTGYYFWDNNIGMAHAHGRYNYRRKYYIFEAALNMDENIFLDLAGNRIDMLWFQEVMAKLKEVDVSTLSWGIAHFIEFLKSKNQFPYRAIRAIDVGAKPKELIRFVPDRENTTNLNPIFIVCLLDKGEDLIQSFKHIRTFPENG